ncbi:SusC/RagA family TonB-linked outer membrane protein [Aquimarina sp. AD10]|uniref:SusC/RagA family TonB-linked outer membrane protein n=1 Tax=Aquimarina aggregata TaxID=1642818 RepID=A0A162CVX4_9FLAO|nr:MULTISPECIES: SusC/RagA family TonB-linked outer membrane protein [Aquimarina]AXT63556.1 SusC/RagA family TonB-linked outer membrane protein [Aquimarina sp. AD10]KZS41859.1 SusC/RagA family TonB-linked outer membrane protein [Aquimarina aggregata]RKM99817.1 SusC/RagA family TonB-linked outer membrane protein [Aquimarina sp. AD10]
MKTFTKSAMLLLWLVPMSFFAQSTVVGTVTDAGSGQPIPGVNIIVRGTSNGTSSDFDGNYSLGNVKDGESIIYSYVGFIEQEVAYTGQATINIVLEEDAAELEQVVLIGYGATRKKDLTGSVALITTEDFNTGNNVTAENLFTGRVAGVNINTNGGPAGNSQIRIRGGASLNASNDPLIVVDGLPINDPNDTNNGSRSVLSAINPNDIESFSILKDASAAAIYGNRGANGVIIITTKKGKKKLQISLNSKTSINTQTDGVDVFSADEFRAYVAENFPDRVADLGNANTDWQDEIYRDAFSSDHNLSVSGSILDALPTRLSIGRSDQEGIRKTSKFERTTTSLSLNPRLFNNHLKIDVNANLNFEKNRFAPGVEGSAITFDPTQPVFDPSSPFGGFFEYTDSNGFAQANVQRNPVAQLLQTRNIANVRRYYGNAKFDYQLHFFPDVRAVLNLGLDTSETNRFEERSTESANTFNSNLGEFNGFKSDTDFTSKNRLLDAYLVYNKDIGNLGVEATGGYSYQKFEVERFETFDQRDPNLEPDVTIEPDVVLLAYFLRANLKLSDKYFLSGSIRRDGTSRFAEDVRFGYFPSASFGWQISEENFLQNSSTLSNLKLRLGYGVTGQQDLGTFANGYLERYRTAGQNTQYILNGEVINIVQAQFRNEDLEWEKITEYNIGLDYGLFNDRISGAIDVFKKESNDLLSSAPVPDAVNFSNQGFQNIGKFTTEGVEFSISADIIKNNNLNWNLSYNVTFIDQEIEELAFGQDIITGGISGGIGNNIQIQRQGESPFSFFTFAQIYDDNGRPIEGAYADLNRDGVINNNDRYISGKPAADITMGLQSSLNYKNFDFSFNMRASIGNEIYNNVESQNAQIGNTFRTVFNNTPVSVLETNFTNTPNVILSDFYIEDASFLRMDNITLGYTLRDVMKGVSSLRLWAGVQNAFVITDYSGLDPEIQNNGIDNTIFPRGRTYLLGLNYNY